MEKQKDKSSSPEDSSVTEEGNRPGEFSKAYLLNSGPSPHYLFCSKNVNSQANATKEELGGLVFEETKEFQRKELQILTFG